ncbi:DUF3168 domain-containing protein [Marinilabilia salmonicolor]|uniref:DUF3168 domain-containing protein n=1 Tax=Marinilabilia salmonicolor TaxID=989 RepID=UPI00029B5166|nr:DUF3168 domain-containing protein [Marinilabilia salmonicolor]
MLNIGLAVNYLLKNNPNITSQVGRNIFPLGVPNVDETGSNVEYPLIIYGRSGVDPDYYKDQSKKDAVTVTIDIWAKSYKQVIEIATDVRSTLENKQGTFAGVRIQESEMISASEAFDLPAYYGQILTFEFK